MRKNRYNVVIVTGWAEISEVFGQSALCPLCLPLFSVSFFVLGIMRLRT